MAPLLTEEESALDPYTILSVSLTSTEKDIRKAYRQASLKYHPDRTSHPDAPAKFREISLALEILVDVAKRQYVDGKLEGERRRKEKYAELDKKRKVMVDALNQREEEAKKAKVEAVQRRKDAAQEEEIKEAGRRMLAEAQKRAAATAAQSSRSESGPSRSNGHTPTVDPQPPISPEDLTIILQFPSTSNLPSTLPTLQPLLEGRYGPITHLIISEPPDTSGETGKKKKKKGRKAVIEFKKGNWGGCWACWKDHMEGAGDGRRRLEEGVKARWAKGETPTWVEWADRQRQVAANGNGGDQGVSSGGNGNGHAPNVPSFNSAPSFSTTSMADLMAEHAGRKEQKKKEEDFESMTLFRMRQAERDRLAEEIRRQEDAE